MTTTPTLAEAIRVVRLVAKTIVIGPELTLVADMAEKAELLSDANRKANGMIGSYADEAKTLADENARLRAALTPSAETKAAYIGEFRFNLPVVNEEGDEIVLTPNVPWTTIKQIMAAIRAYAQSDAALETPHEP
jgi:hypothetical protein